MHTVANWADYRTVVPTGIIYTRMEAQGRRYTVVVDHPKPFEINESFQSSTGFTASWRIRHHRPDLRGGG